MKNVIQLIRVSTEAQAKDDRGSIPAQRAVNRHTCVQYGLTVVRSIEIADVSGASVLLAPEMQELLRLIESPGIHGVVTREFSRLMRPENFADYALLQAFADTRTVLYLPEGPIDLSNKSGRLLGTIRAAIAGMERTEILERVWSAKEEKRRRGELAQSEIVLPYGVGYSKDHGFHYEGDAERVREAYRRFLSGEQNYNTLAQILGVTSRGAHLILRNPIYTGWRIIDKKRDVSAAGRYASINGRQTDRRKIARAPEDVIRVKVIEKGLISEGEFQAAQRIMDLKQARHWRSRPGYEHRFTYRGFLTCSNCGGPIHTAFARRDYYACKARRGLHKCNTPYMRRERLEGSLDALFANRLTDPAFVEQCVETMKTKARQSDTAVRIQGLNSQTTALRQKRGRVIETYLDGVISREDRDRRLVAIDRELQIIEELLMSEMPANSIDLHTLVEAFAPLAEFQYWTQDHKRSILAAMTPDIRCADYKIESLGITAALFSTENSHRGKGS